MEVFYPNQFTTERPQGIGGEWRKFYDGEEQKNVKDICVPILQLAHITHNAEAHQIGTDLSFQFRVAPKYGRPGMGSCMWNPDINGFVPIDQKTNLFPGNYSWWSPYAHNYHLPRDHLNRENCRSPAQIAQIIPQGDYYVANYLKHPPESIYGNCVFHCSLTELLIAYGESRFSHEIFIKIGGTLRYRGEICFVLIVCTENDALDFPPLRTNDEYFKTNGLIDNHGKVMDRKAIANFHPRHIIQWSREYKKKVNHSYITAAFAFYYPDRLAVKREWCGTAEIRSHTVEYEYCLKQEKGKCPNNYC